MRRLAFLFAGLVWILWTCVWFGQLAFPEEGITWQSFMLNFVYWAIGSVLLVVVGVIVLAFGPVVWDWVEKLGKEEE